MNDARRVGKIIDAQYPDTVRIGNSGGYVSYAARRADGSQIVGVYMPSSPVTEEEAAQAIIDKLDLKRSMEYISRQRPPPPKVIEALK